MLMKDWESEVDLIVFDFLLLVAVWMELIDVMNVVVADVAEDGSEFVIESAPGG